MNNRKITAKMISLMSKQSLKSSRMRNIFVMITIVLAAALRSDWYKKWPDMDALSGIDAEGKENAPGWSLEALEYIYKVRNAAANGHETLDTDSSAVAEEKGDLACERYVLDNDKLQVEVLANLDKVQPAGAVVIVSYPRIEGATGLPARVWAITE